MEMCGDSSIAEKWINGHCAVFREHNRETDHPRSWERKGKSPLGPFPQALSWVVLGNQTADVGKHGVLYHSIPRPHAHTKTTKLRKRTYSRTDFPSIQQTSAITVKIVEIAVSLEVVGLASLHTVVATTEDVLTSEMTERPLTSQ